MVRKSIFIVALGLFVLLAFWRPGFKASAGQGGGGGRVATENGDINGDGLRDISDAISLLSWLFQGGPDPVAFAGGIAEEVQRLRISNPDGRSSLFFGPTDDCSIGIDPELPGLTERDPIGFRLLGPGGQGCRLIFGPTMDCTVEVDPAGPPGLLLRDPRGIRILVPRDMPVPVGPRIIFGPTDDCSIGLDARLPGLVERDPVGFRLLGQNNQGCRLIFGPTMDCTIEVDPAGPMGLLLRDPRGIRIMAPDLPGALPEPRLLFGPTDDCSIGIDPRFPGLVERDPVGFRLLGQNNQGCRLIFGPTMDCTIEVDPNGPSGLLLRDPRGIRLLTPGRGPPLLLFGPTDECLISLDPEKGGMLFKDPRGFRFIGGPVFASQFVPTSARRFKEDIKPLEGALETIEKLQGVSFRWNAELGGKQSVGFVADEVAEVLPEVVAYEQDGTSVRGLNYDSIIAVAVEGIKEQQERIVALESENAALKDELGGLRSELDGLRKSLGAIEQQLSALAAASAPK
jgi:hypothetical protein